jgi:hypothetical protein
MARACAQRLKKFLELLLLSASLTKPVLSNLIEKTG